MVRVSFWCAVLVFLVLPAAGAQDFAADALLSAPALSEYERFLIGVRGISGASWFVLALVVAQGLFLLLRTVCGEILGIYRLLVLAILSVLATIGANILGGKTIIQSVLLDASTLMAYQVMFHQIKRQWEKRNEDRERINLERASDSLRVEEPKKRFSSKPNRFKFFRRRDSH